jgi:molybdopterin-guanine dinucleotide biosynthesis protein A
MTPGAVIVCGGESRRMGRPKAWLPFGPEALLQRVVRLVSAAADPLVVVAAPGQALPELPPSVTVVRDPVPGRGPLQGIAAGLAALPDSVEFAYATATDVPFFRPEWVARLVELIGDHDLAIPHTDGYFHPLAALYRRTTVSPAVQELLSADRLRPVFLTEAVRTRVVSADELRAADPDLSTLRNLNTPDEYEAALTDAGLSPADEGAARLTVELYGVPRLKAGVGAVSLTASTAGEAVAALGRACPGLVGPVIVAGALHPAYVLNRNGDQFVTDPGERLSDGDVLLLLSVDVGG